MSIQNKREKRNLDFSLWNQRFSKEKRERNKRELKEIFCANACIVHSGPAVIVSQLLSGQLSLPFAQLVQNGLLRFEGFAL